MTDTSDAALEALRRQLFYRAMSEAEERLRADPSQWEAYVTERDVWLNTDLKSQ